MGKRKSGDDQSAAAAYCPKCDPPGHLAQQLGSGIGAYRYRHYLEYHSTRDLETHLRSAAKRYPTPILGYDLDTWLAGVLRFHERRQIERAKAERWGIGG